MERGCSERHPTELRDAGVRKAACEFAGAVSSASHLNLVCFFVFCDEDHVVSGLGASLSVCVTSGQEQLPPLMFWCTPVPVQEQVHFTPSRKLH